jgi:tetrapyrrole methylase family protein / MazG family protein
VQNPLGKLDERRVMVKPPTNLRSFESLLDVMKALRGPDGCPWDKEQTHKTLVPYAIEEAHELAEAIESDDEAELVSELGDVLLQVVLHAEIARQENRFDVFDVIATLNEKMVRRHPHVFSDVEVANIDEVWSNWKKIKEVEKEGKKTSDKFDIPINLPALTRSSKIGSKTKGFRFDWENAEQVLMKVEEEIAELKEAIRSGKTEEKEHELGDILFSVAQVARHLKIEPEQALRVANARFEKRFFKMKEIAEAAGKNFSNLSNDELEALWKQVKIELDKP